MLKNILANKRLDISADPHKGHVEDEGDAFTETVVMCEDDNPFFHEVLIRSLSPMAGSDPAVDASPARYSLRRLLARGGQGEIWTALQGSLGRTVAVKTIARTVGQIYSDAELEILATNFRREARITSLLEHPGIVPVYDYGLEENGLPVLVMRLIEGTPWNELLQDHSASEADYLNRHLGILVRVAQTVAFAHSRGILHCDLKPTQVMVGNYGEVFLMDWGLAVFYRGDEDDDISTEHNAEQKAVQRKRWVISGTPAYMAPEQTKGKLECLGPSTDVFLLGGMLYELLTGTPPHKRPSEGSPLKPSERGEVESPRLRAPHRNMPEELLSLCELAMCSDPELRLQDAQSFVDGLETFLSGANRRLQSQKVFEAAAESYTEDLDDYATLQALDFQLTRSLAISSDNHAAAEMSRKVLKRFAEHAVRAGDLKLARIQAMRLPENDERTNLLETICEAEKREVRHGQQRRAGILTAVGFVGCCMLLCIALFSMYIRDIQNREHLKYTQLVKKTKDLALTEQQLTKQISAAAPLPTSLLEKTNASDDKHRRLLAELEASAVQSDAMRRSLKASGATLPVKGSGYFVALAALRLQQAETRDDYLAVYDEFGRAYKTLWSRNLSDRGLVQKAMTGMGISAARAGYMTSASLHLHRAAIESLTANGPDPNVANLSLEANRLRNLLTPLTSDDLIIEAGYGGRNREHYVETEGRWMDSGTPYLSKSIAPGLTSPEICGTRKYQFSGMEKNAKPAHAAARFLPRVDAAKRYHVYVTWPTAANAAPVQLTIRHAYGEKSFQASAKGSAPVASNANSWISLGEFAFNPGDDQFVEMRITPDATPVASDARGQVIADAVRFSATPLSETEHTRIALIERFDQAPPPADAKSIALQARLPRF